MKQAASLAVPARSKRAEGQVRGIREMLDEDRYCTDILTQIQAVRARLHTLKGAVLKGHINGRVTEAFASGDAEARQTKVDELVGTIGRMTR